MTLKSQPATMAANGRLVVPLEVRRAVGLEAGGKLLARVEDGRIVLETVEAAVARVQKLARRYGSPDRSLADELITERRAEAAHD
ncbi:MULTISPECIES: AbrB/MazE/SpoVT family DNA-binding domain-containing protein [Nitrospirillum]|uniref:AbrB family looped-hinge helix DNA binding protein n=1 Tax=Nitrospirillum amazonense TaxID=28077 RepID=A0A560FZE9_9PROT|nr:AbrB/MazE/SpoVT family DNA-binding domain-containing protein [Nitrospirillum amazonense]MEC4591174.1 AbrB/MazE/SpoVT family DNA-binding domain-containing protein [Nitrospirillum amazonense]TWB27017.1 AbrB family looped-hinge helix DNA binding protein [Nitrospirillum amazonense]